MTTDWTLRASTQANLRGGVKRVLRKHGHPPDKQERATQTLLAPATLMAKDWAG